MDASIDECNGTPGEEAGGRMEHTEAGVDPGVQKGLPIGNYLKQLRCTWDFSEKGRLVFISRKWFIFSSVCPG